MFVSVSLDLRVWRRGWQRIDEEALQGKSEEGGTVQEIRPAKWNSRASLKGGRRIKEKREKGR